MSHHPVTSDVPSGLYTPEERKRRDETVWTVVQGILAPVQFFVFLISLVLVVRYLWTGLGFELATWSIVAKTMCLYVIMVTGAIWEKVELREPKMCSCCFCHRQVGMK